MASLRINDFNQKVDSFINGLPSAMLKINKKLALDAIPKITSRLIDNGLTAEGKSLGKYSTKPMSPLFFLGHGLKVADKRINSELKRQKKTGQKTGISYEQVREFNNLPTEHVTLSFTGETLRDIGVIDGTIQGSSVITTIGSKNSKTKDIFNAKGKKTGTKTTGEILDDLNEKYGRALDTDLLDLTPNEEKDSSERLDQELQKYIDKKFT